MTKKLICLLITIAMVLTMLPGVAFAANTAGLDNFKKVQTYTDGQFTDVKSQDWFEENVAAAYELNLMVGRSGKFFDTESNLTVAEAMTIAARLREIYYTGKAEFVQGEPWYQVYTDYCKTNGIANPDDYDLNKVITRGQFAEIFSKAFPAEALKKINNVQDNMIPDVSKTDKFSAAIYLLYRAGILTGNDSKGTFASETNIKRIEAAAITTRMAQPTLRKSITLVKQSSGGGSYTPPVVTPTDVAIENVTVSDTGKIKTGEGTISVTSGDGTTEQTLTVQQAKQLATKLNTMLDSAPVAKFSETNLEKSSNINTTDGLKSIIKELKDATNDNTVKENIESKTANDIDLQVKIVLSNVNVNSSDDLTVTSIEFDVTPIATTTVKDSTGKTVSVSTEIKTELSENVKFRLPIDSSLNVTGNKIAVYHENEFLGNYEIKGVAPNTYIEIESKNFSKYGYQLVNENNAGAKIGGKFYFKFADAVAAVQDGETITLLKPATGDNSKVTISRAVSFTVEKNSKEYGDQLTAGDDFDLEKEVSGTSIKYNIVLVTSIEKPTAVSGLIYNGEEQTGVAEDTGYTVENGKKTNAGEYTATVKLLAGYKWVDDTTSDLEINWSIAKAAYDMSGVTFEDKTVEYNGQEQEIKISGELPEGVEVSYSENKGKDARSYGATAKFTGDEENYEPIDDMSATLTIQEASLTATADDKNVTVGSDAPEYTVTYTGWVEGESIETVTPKTQPVLTCNYTQDSVAGEYAITFTTWPDFDNYDVNAVNGKLTAVATYTVTFDMNGIDVPAPNSQTITSGDKITKPTNPIFADHTLEGWYKTKDATTGKLSNKWNFDTDTVSENMTLYAQWTRTMGSILGTNNEISKSDDMTAPAKAWVNSSNADCKAFIGKDGGNEYFVIKKEALALSPSMGMNDVFIKIDDNTYEKVVTGIGTFTVNMLEGNFTSYKFEASDNECSELNGTYTAPTFKAVYDTTGGANELTFYYDSSKHNANEDTIILYDNLPTAATKPTDWGYSNKRASIKSVVIDSSVANYHGLTSTAFMFQGMSTAVTISGVGNLDTSGVTDMSYMFTGCKVLGSLDLQGLNTSSVECMSRMFYQCEALNSLNLRDFDTGKVEKMDYMFDSCKALGTMTFGNNFNTLNVTTMQNMFNNCIALTSLDLGKFNTSHVTVMENMFKDCKELASLNLGSFNTENVEKLSHMFENCEKLESLDLSNFETSTVTSMMSMFQGCKKLASIDLSRFTIGEQTELNIMFKDCPKLASVKINNENNKIKDTLNNFCSGWVYDTVNSCYERTTFIVAFDMQGHGAQCNPTTGLDSGSKISALDVPTEAGFEFKGWYKEESCENEWLIATDTVTADITLYAKWEAVNTEE